MTDLAPSPPVTAAEEPATNNQVHELQGTFYKKAIDAAAKLLDFELLRVERPGDKPADLA